MMSIYSFIVPLVLAYLAHCASVPLPAQSKRNVWTGPVNQVAMAGQAAVLDLDCSTEADLPPQTTRVQWWEYGTRGSGNLISDVAQLLQAHPKYNKFTLATDTAVGIHRLSFKENAITVDDGTVYRCTDFYSTNSSQASFGAQLVVIKELPSIITTITKSIVVEGDYHSVEALIEFGASYPIAPLMTWIGPTPFGQRSAVTNRTVWSGINFNVNRSMNNYTFDLKVNFTDQGFGGPGMANNVPVWEYTYQSLQLNVLWRPKNLFFTPSQSTYDVGTTVTCFADANPVAVYTWQAIEGPVSGRIWQAPDFVITADMFGENIMRCNARNTIEGTVYTNDLFAIIQVNDPSVSRTSTVPTTQSSVPSTQSSVPSTQSTSPATVSF